MIFSAFFFDGFSINLVTLYIEFTNLFDTFKLKENFEGTFNPLKDPIKEKFDEE